MYFREAMQALGLVRKNRGRLMLTKAGTAARDEPGRVWRHLQDRLPIGTDKSMDRPSGWLFLVRAAAGDASPYEAIAAAMTCLGWREDNRAPVGSRAVRDAVSLSTAVLRNLSASSSGSFGSTGWPGTGEVDPVVRDLCHQILRGDSYLPAR